MAIAYQSYKANYSTTGTTVTVDKPTSLAVGDLMIGYFTCDWDCPYDSTAPTLTQPSGWTQIVQTGKSPQGISVCYDGIQTQISFKYATQSDVDATSFTFTSSNSGQSKEAQILRITGARVSSAVYDYDYTTGYSGSDSGPSLTCPSIDVGFADSMILMFISASNSTMDPSNYAIATSNPSWTEILDGSSPYSNNCAYAVRTESTATGGSTAHGDSNYTNWVFITLSLSPAQSWSTTISETVTDTEIITSFRGILLEINDTTKGSDSIETSKSRQWNKTSKPTTTWTKINK